MTDLAAARARYADIVAPDDPRIRAAFAAVPREAFLGPPPWRLLTGWPPPFTERETGDPAELYQDALVVLDAVKRLNNGQPSLHAHMLGLLDPQPGDDVLHAGAGSGYYSALLAELAGRVAAVEFDPALAAAACANLADRANVTVICGDAAEWPRVTVQRIYINFAIACPAAAWLDHLAVGGVLLAPFGVPDPDAPAGQGAQAVLLKITRTRDGYAAAFDWQVGFVFAAGETAGDAAQRAAVWAALQRGGREDVRSLLRTAADPERCWLATPGFSLSRDPP